MCVFTTHLQVTMLEERNQQRLDSLLAKFAVGQSHSEVTNLKSQLKAREVSLPQCLEEEGVPDDLSLIIKSMT